MTDTIAMAYDPETFTLLKHGTPATVKAWLDNYKQYGMAANMITFDKTTPIEEINKVLSITGYLRYIISN